VTDGQKQTVTDYKAAAQNLISHMDRCGVAKALLMPPPQIPGQKGSPDYEDLLEAVKAFPDRILLVGGGRTLNSLINGTKAEDVTPFLRKQFEAEAAKLIRHGAKAFGEIAALHLSFTQRHVFEQTSPDHPLFLLLADLAARHDVPVDLHMEAVPKKMKTPAGFDRRSSNNPETLAPNIAAFERLLKHNRKARIVWQHIGWDNTGHMTIALLRRLLKAHSNLFLALRVEEREDTMGGTPMPNRIVDKDWKLRPDWLALIKEFPDRFTVGTDEFIGIPGKTRRRPQSFDETWAVLEQMPPELAKKVGHDNAARVYRVE